MLILHTEHRERWMKVLQRTFQHDFYHRPEYHLLAERRGEGKARLFVHEEQGYLIALPLLLRPVELAGFGHGGKEWSDATSVYGYAGPVASHPAVPASVLENFRGSLREALRRLSVISVFSRLHPLIPHMPFLCGLGTFFPSGKTISIDLTLHPEEQRAKYRKNHNRDIKRQRKMGLVCVEDAHGEHLQSFVEIYLGTMRRVKASTYYFFDYSYFETFREYFGPNLSLFFIRDGDRFACGGLFVECHGILQYHLGGTRDEYLEQAPMKLLVDSVRQWATRKGLRALHLGGGVHGREDALFAFKAGFSDQYHEFVTWRWTPEPELYAEACACKERSNAMHGLRSVSADFYPQYRAPSLPLSDARFASA